MAGAERAVWCFGSRLRPSSRRCAPDEAHWCEAVGGGPGEAGQAADGLGGATVVRCAGVRGCVVLRRDAVVTYVTEICLVKKKLTQGFSQIVMKSWKKKRKRKG